MSPDTQTIDIPDGCHELIRFAYEYWHSKRLAEGLPGRQHIDPIDFPRLLPYVRLIEIKGEPPEFKIRLMGTESVEFFERDFTGYCYHELCPRFRGSKSETTLLSVVRTGKPDWRRGPGRIFKKKQYKNIERVILPLASNGTDTDMLLVVHVFEKNTAMDQVMTQAWGTWRHASSNL